MLAGAGSPSAEGLAQKWGLADMGKGLVLLSPGRVRLLVGCPQVRDAVAVIQYLLWLEKNVPKGSVDEFSGARYVDKLRRSVRA